ncbi:hypothetical protein BDFB_009201 [Asbolus verrucosus]|uniref:Uncharacterized protein n=1 Tax=Asbolus verrucosus TaxID=1661398 RepID=A0A482VDS8_ASBVE|nr:hypothetical protein BDFB_009201 [Asbolus verrucosus]
MTADLNQHILNLKPSVVPQPPHEPYTLTFFVENETDNNARHLQLTDFTDSQSHRQAYSNYYDDVIVESYENPVDKAKFSRYGRGAGHESYCVLSALLYFVTVTTFVYLAILWIKQKMYIRMEQMHWW